MSDLNSPKAKLTLARLDIQIDEQTLVIEGREVRLGEIEEERGNVEADITSAEKAAKEVEEQVARIKDRSTLDARRLMMKAHQHRILIKSKHLRLLELEDERQTVERDIDASRAHIEKLKAEVRQQETRLKENPDG